MNNIQHVYINGSVRDEFGLGSYNAASGNFAVVGSNAYNGTAANANDYKTLPLDNTWRKYEMLYFLIGDKFNDWTATSASLRFFFNTLKGAAPSYVEIADIEYSVLRFDETAYDALPGGALRRQNFNEAVTQWTSLALTEGLESIKTGENVITPVLGQKDYEITTNLMRNLPDISFTSRSFDYPVEIEKISDVPIKYQIKLMSLACDKTKLT